MLEIEVFANRTKLIGKYPKEEIDLLTSAYVTGYQFTSVYKLGSWDGKFHGLRRDTIYTGMLPFVIELLDHKKVPYKITYKYYPNLPEEYVFPDNVAGKPLYTHQKEAIQTFLNTDVILPHRGIISAGTGSGKTWIGALIAHTMKLKTLFLVHGKNLSKQNYEVFKTIFKEDLSKIGFVMADTWEIGQVTVASVDTLYSRLKAKDDKVAKLLKGTQLLVVDEVHRAKSTSFETVMRETNAPFRLGLSGTPLVKDAAKDLLLQGLIGPVIYSKDIASLQKEKLVSDAVLNSVVIDFPKSVDLEYTDAMNYLVYNNVYRNNIIVKIVEQKIKEKKTGLVICGNSVALTKNIFHLLSKNHSEDQVRLCYGETKLSYSEESLELLKNRKLNFIINSKTLNEGIDIPAIDCLIVASSGRGYVQTIQRIGRGLRLSHKDKVLEVYDLYDETNPYLVKHSKKRMEYYKEAGFFSDISNIQCSSIAPYPDTDINKDFYGGNITTEEEQDDIYDF